MTQVLSLLDCFLPRFKIKCIFQYMDIRLLRLFTVVQMQGKILDVYKRQSLTETNLTGGGEQFLMMQGMNGTHDIQWLTIMMLIHFVFTLFSLSSGDVYKRQVQGSL